ncbi:MAG: hypothetical protein OEW77_03120, partial [Gemmatimonadota bacterium]|nr:hypothetical protein [Gemmatimonadota bacterium]
MSFRRLILPLVLVVVAVACSDAPPPLAPPTQMAGPQFLRWAPSVPTQFQAVGAVTVSKPTGLAGSGGMANLVAAAAPVAVDNASSVTASTQTLSWSHTVGSGVNRFLLVGVSIRSAKSSVTGVTYGGRSLSLVGAQNNSDNAVRTEIWRLAAPASGTAA